MPIDYSKYPPNWKTEIVPRILKRAGNSCEFCHIMNGSHATSFGLRVNIGGKYKVKRFWLINPSDAQRMRPYTIDEKIVKVVLTVAHLDHDETNHEVSDERLRALCQYCHLNYDAEEKYRRACAKEE